MDRALINGSWISCFPQSQVEFLPPEVSDHYLILIQLQQESFIIPKPLKFFNYWIKHARFLEIVELSWQGMLRRVPMFILH